jgi:16S rRNA (cytidine1402-2'-O)-methyltransferase
VKGRIFLIPVLLGGDDFNSVLPRRAIDVAKKLKYFIVEDIRSARRFLRLIDREFPIDSTVFYELNEHTGNKDISHFLDPALNGNDIGLMSEAGMPGIADPGNTIIALAHRMNITVTPLAGPSSIIMALISSGLNGQNFTFHGYLPVEITTRISKIRNLEKMARSGYAQIFMETPYRNDRLLESVLATCNSETLLCIAADITLPAESIVTKRISEWRKQPPLLKDRLVIFVLQ